MRQYLRSLGEIGMVNSNSYCTFYEYKQEVLDFSIDGKVKKRYGLFKVKILPAPEKIEGLERKLYSKIEEREVPPCIDYIVDIS